MFCISLSAVWCQFFVYVCLHIGYLLLLLSWASPMNLFDSYCFEGLPYLIKLLRGIQSFLTTLLTLQSSSNLQIIQPCIIHLNVSYYILYCLSRITINLNLWQWCTHFVIDLCKVIFSLVLWHTVLHFWKSARALTSFCQ